MNNNYFEKCHLLMNKLSKQNKQMIKLQVDFADLEEENKHLKKELKRCRDWLNSDKYDYELTLAFIKNKGYSLKDVLEYQKELSE